MFENYSLTQPQIWTPHTPGLALERLQIGDQVANLILVQRKFGQSRMAGPDALGKRLFQILDGIPLQAL